jgi:Uma2 family endonuclease
MSYLSPAEYLESEQRSGFKSEYYQGKMFAMAGASPRHAIIVLNLAIALRHRLEGNPCEVYVTDLRLRVSATGLYTYPDVMVACGEQQFADDAPNTLVNPVLIIEVLSDSTRDYDRSGKFQHYRSLASLREYVTIEQDSVRVERHTRQADNSWLLTEFQDPAQIFELSSVGCQLPVAEIYSRIEWNRL